MTKKILILLSSLLLASSLSLIFSPLLANNLPFQLFSKEIPAISDELIFKKTFDILDVLLTGIFTLLLFLINSNFFKIRKITPNLISVVTLSTLSAVIFLQTHFVTFSKKSTLILLIISEITFLSLSLLKPEIISKLIHKIKILSKSELILALGNGIFLGFFLLLFTNTYLQIPLLSLSLLFLIPLLFLILSASHPKLVFSFPGLLLFLAIFNPTSFVYLFGLGITTFLIWLANYYFGKNILLKPFFARYIYPFLVISLIVYQPNFFIGNFDSVEEGFFLGWVERLKQGQALYKDVLVYHPPVLIWGMYLFQKLMGFTIYSERLFLHLLQILGSIIYFFYLKKFSKSLALISLGMLLFLSFSQTPVRNNIEIRLGIGLLSLIFLFNYLKSFSLKWLIASGAVCALALFVSLEVGLATLVVGLVGINLFSIKRTFQSFLKNNLIFFCGLFLTSAPVIAYLFSTNSLFQFFDQLSFYAQAFSKGYFNSEAPRTISLSFFHWHIFDQYIASHAFYFEISKLIVIGAFVYYSVKFLSKRFNLSLEEKHVFLNSILGLILLRVALGRSDFYHLLFVLTIAFATLIYLLQKLSQKTILTLVLGVLIVFYFARPIINNAYLETQLFKFQTYGKILEEYNKYEFEAGKQTLVGKEINTKELDALVKTITIKSSPDDSIFVFPWMPELYFYTDRENTTSIDTPYAFFTENHQQQMIARLQNNPPKFIVYNPEMRFGNLTPKSLSLINDYIEKNYQTQETIGQNQIRTKKSE